MFVCPVGMMTRSSIFTVALAVAACSGIGGAREAPRGAAEPRTPDDAISGHGGGASDPASGGPAPALPTVHFASATRRLNRAELRQTILDLTGLDLSPEIARFPEDHGDAGDVFAFDNRYSLQQPSPALIEAARSLADTVGARVLSDASVRARLIPCTPTGPGDADCLRAVVSTFGRRALRRALTADEVSGYVTRLGALAAEAGDFDRAVALLARVLLQDLEFLYRIEVGTAVAGTPGLTKLGGYEVATRLSYLLWGTTPDDTLLAAAETGDRLGTAAAVRAAAVRMLGDARASRAIARFHALWLGYEREPPGGPLAASMQGETSALIERVVMQDRRSWLDLFRAKESHVDRALAAHYGLPAPAVTGWVPYGATGRQGILSHATFLGVERKHEDTSPTMRGHFVRTRLLCQAIAQPPADVDTDAVPTTGDCKSDRYAMWKTPGCQACHLLMDPIGHGLEAYDRVGRARAFAPADIGKSGCAISGRGELTGVDGGAFQGVAGLADRLVSSGMLEACVTTQLAHFALGREIRPSEQGAVDALAARFRASGHRFDEMLLDLVSMPGFGYRIAE